jgi:hypothetical protein
MNSLQGPSVMAVVGELVAAGVSQHVRAHLEGILRPRPEDGAGIAQCEPADRHCSRQAVALANKTARIAWAVMLREKEYQPTAVAA